MNPPPFTKEGRPRTRVHGVGPARFWTKDNVLAALKHYASHRRGQLPHFGVYAALPKPKLGLPPYDRIAEYFPTIREAWRATGVGPERWPRYGLWQEWEDDFIRVNYGRMTLAEVARKLGRREQSTKTHIAALECHSNHGLTEMMPISVAAASLGVHPARVAELVLIHSMIHVNDKGLHPGACSDYRVAMDRRGRGRPRVAWEFVLEHENYLKRPREPRERWYPENVRQAETLGKKTVRMQGYRSRYL